MKGKEIHKGICLFISIVFLVQNTILLADSQSASALMPDSKRIIERMDEVYDILAMLFKVDSPEGVMRHIAENGITLNDMHDLLNVFSDRYIAKGEIAEFLNPLYRAIIEPKRGAQISPKAQDFTQAVRDGVIAYFNRELEEGGFQKMMTECPYMALQGIVGLRTLDFRQDKIGVSCERL